MAVSGYSVWTSADAAAVNPTVIEIIAASAGTAGDYVTVEPR